MIRAQSRIARLTAAAAISFLSPLAHSPAVACDTPRLTSSNPEAPTDWDSLAGIIGFYHLSRGNIHSEWIPRAFHRRAPGITSREDFYAFLQDPSYPGYVRDLLFRHHEDRVRMLREPFRGFAHIRPLDEEVWDALPSPHFDGLLMQDSILGGEQRGVHVIDLQPAQRNLPAIEPPKAP